jgi:hypothetical protein
MEQPMLVAEVVVATKAAVKHQPPPEELAAAEREVITQLALAQRVQQTLAVVAEVGHMAQQAQSL